MVAPSAPSNEASARPADAESAAASQDDRGSDNPESPANESFTPATTGDAPTSNDQLGFKHYARALSEFLLNPETQGPLTVSVEGEWGSGKSSFMLMLEDQLRKASADKQKRGVKHNVPIIAEFNPWRHDRDEALWAAFAMGLTKEIAKQQRLLDRLKGHLRLFTSRFEWRHGWIELAKALAVWLIATALALSILTLTVKRGPAWLAEFAQKVTISGEGKGAADSDKNAEQRLSHAPSEAQKSTERPPCNNEASPPPSVPDWYRWLSGFGFFGVLAAYLVSVLSVLAKLQTLFSTPLAVKISKHMKSPDYASRVSFIEEFHEDVKRVVESHARGKTVFVFVDDLDRCSVPKAAELMQAINLMISTKLTNIVYILGMDRGKIAAGLAAKSAELLPYLYPDSLATSDSRSLPPLTGLQFGFEYIEKFIQVVFPLPQPRNNDVGQYLRSLAGLSAGQKGAPEKGPREAAGSAVSPPPISGAPPPGGAPPQGDAQPASASPEFQVEFSTDSENVRGVAREVSRFFQDNPRRLKQFINVFRLRAFIAYETGVLRPGRLTPEQLGKLVALQMRWPVWAGACFRNPERLKALSGDKPLDLAGSDPELKALLGLGRGGAPPGKAWDLQEADLEGFVRVSPVVRTVDLDRVPEIKRPTPAAQGLPAPAAPGSQEDASQIRVSVDEAPARVLWVDNDLTNNTELRERIEDSFHVEFTLCTSTAEALERAATQTFALVISDMGRPGDFHAGYTLLRKLRENGNNAPFLIYSSRAAGGAEKDHAKKLGALDFTDQSQDVMNAVERIARRKLQDRVPQR